MSRVPWGAKGEKQTNKNTHQHSGHFMPDLNCSKYHQIWKMLLSKIAGPVAKHCLCCGIKSPRCYRWSGLACTLWADGAGDLRVRQILCTVSFRQMSFPGINFKTEITYPHYLVPHAFWMVNTSVQYLFAQCVSCGWREGGSNRQKWCSRVAVSQQWDAAPTRLSDGQSHADFQVFVLYWTRILTFFSGQKKEKKNLYCLG